MSNSIITTIKNKKAFETPLRYRANLLALAAIHGDKNVAKHFKYSDGVFNSWRANLTTQAYQMYNLTAVGEEAALAKQYYVRNGKLNINRMLKLSEGNPLGIIDLKNPEDLKRARITLRKQLGRTHQWFREETGNKNLVLYDTTMFEIRKIKNGPKFLHYKADAEAKALAPVIPINASSCYCMFAFNDNLEHIDLSKLNTTDIVTMHGMFAFCKNLKRLNTCLIRTDNAKDLTDMFRACASLTELNLCNVSLKEVETTKGMFANCSSLKKIITTKGFNSKNVQNAYNMFFSCVSLPNYRAGILVPSFMICSVEKGGYLTIIKNEVTDNDYKYFVELEKTEDGYH